MARKKKKATPFAKLILFLLISTPILYLGISYATGQDGIQNLKKSIGLGKKTDKTVKSYPAPASISIEERDKIYQEIEEMKDKLRLKDQEINNLKAALEAHKPTKQ